MASLSGSRFHLVLTALNKASMSAVCIFAIALLCFAPPALCASYNQAAPGDAIKYLVADPANFDLTNFNNFLYSIQEGPPSSKYVVVPAGTYTANPSIADNFGESVSFTAAIRR